MSGAASIAGKAEWLPNKHLQHLLLVLSEGSEEARIAGGAVRNALLGEPVADIDIATTTLPAETMRRAEAAGFKIVPTGAEHGTITVIAAGRPFEVTTLRADIETDGRRAKVHFGRDWQRDAERRDFTINALYATAGGAVIDLVGGIADLESRTIRFIGDADMRIREDFLRILRFFRFFAWYGAGRPDAAGLKACARLKEGLDLLVGRARLDGAEETAVGVGSFARAVVDASGRRADARAAGKREMGHRPHPPPCQGRSRSRLACRSAAAARSLAAARRRSHEGARRTAEAVDRRSRAAEGMGAAAGHRRQ